MQLEVMTKPEMRSLINRQYFHLNRKITVLEKRLNEKEDRVIKALEIKEILGISQSTFNRRIPELTHFGLSKDGTYCMLLSELHKYQEWKKNN